MKKIILLILITLLLPGSLKCEDSTAVKIAVLPLEVLSIEKKPGFGVETAAGMTRYLAGNPYIILCNSKAINSTVKDDEYASLSEKRLKEISRLLSVNFLVFGSITMISNEVSIDIQMYNNFLPDSYFKTFAEGTDLDDIVDEICREIEQEILDKSDLIPPSQRISIKLESKKESGRTLIQEYHISDKDELKGNTGSDVATAGQSDSVEWNEYQGSAEEGDKVVDDPFIIYDQQRKKDLDVSEKSLEPENDKQTPKNIKSKKSRNKTPFKSDQPININADTMVYDNRQSMATFKGSVVARQDNIVIFADEMKVFYSDKGGLNKLFAVGNVKIIQGDTIATGKKIVFYNNSQKIVATGNPRVWQGDNVVHGRKITVYLKEDRTVVDGGPGGRASATIYPGKNKQ